MKKLYTFLLLVMLCSGAKLFAQNCSSMATSYDLTVTSYLSIPPAQSQPYIQGYICSGATLVDSAMCCTRICHVDSGATLIVGPNSYGFAYVKSGGTFNGQGASGSWQISIEPGAIVLNHTGITQTCSSVSFISGNCTMSIAEQFGKTALVVQNSDQLIFHYTDVLNAPRVELYDQSGKLVLNATTGSGTSQTVDISGLAAGIYLWRVYDGEEAIDSDKIAIVK